MTRITLSRVTDWSGVGERWRALEVRSECSFFQSWTWTGCLADERFDEPILLEAFDDGQCTVMALFNRRRDWAGREMLFLGESGHAGRDAVFIEWNGLLAAGGTPATVLAECLRAACLEPVAGRRPRTPRRLVLSGVGPATLEAAHIAGATLHVRRGIAAPFVDLAELRRTGRDYLAALSANARYQVRRSDRGYGDLALQRANSRDQAFDFLGQLISLHQATWRRRGKRGAFVDPYFTTFHRKLIERGLERGEIALLRVAASRGVVGLLYNFEWRGEALTYQSGFDYLGAAPHQKPGLTCHHQAIEDAAARGLDRYDFLAGADRYKRSLATSETVLHWVELGTPGVELRALRWLRGKATRKWRLSDP